MKKKLIFNKGITLIALVITIIVLLILAGVSIATLTGPNGLISQADEAKNKTSEAEAEERVHLEVVGSYGEDGIIDMNKLNINLRNVPKLTYKGHILDDDNRIESLPDTVRVDIYDVTIEKNGEVHTQKSEDIEEEKNVITIECNPENNSAYAQSQEVNIIITSKLKITSKQIKATWSQENLEEGKLPENFETSAELISVEGEENTLTGRIFNAGVNQTGSYYLYIEANINGEIVIKKVGTYQLQKVPIPSDIIITPTKTETTSVTIEITTTEKFNGYELEYRKENEDTWTPYEGKITIDENTTLYVRLYNKNTGSSIENNFTVEGIVCLHTTMVSINNDSHQCTKCGYTESHKMGQLTGTTASSYHECTVCKSQFAHNWAHNNSTVQHQCTGCGKIENHTYTASGNNDLCSKCSYTKGHSWTIVSSSNNGTHKCNSCNLVQNHNWSSNDCPDGKHKCTICAAVANCQFACCRWGTM